LFSIEKEIKFTLTLSRVNDHEVEKSVFLALKRKTGKAAAQGHSHLPSAPSLLQKFLFCIASS
jgi:hypothetical protein